MAKRSNNSLGRRSYGGKPYDANNSFVKKMANKVTDFIPQRSWISKWFNASQDNGDASAGDRENLDETETEEEVQQPPSKRPRIRMDVTHPPGTFFIRPRDRDSSNDNDSRKDPFLRANESEQNSLEPPMAGPSGISRFISSTPALQTDMRNSNMQRAELNCLIPSENNRATNGADDNSESSESTSGCSSLIPQTNRQEGAMSTAYHTNMASRKRLIDDKLAFTNHLQSPRCLFLDGNSRESLSSRRPSFNASMMNNTLDRTSSLSSPFYSGNVTFGGANALGHYKRSRSLFNSTNEFQLKVPRRTSVQVKPSNSECIDASGMSQTAKRILEAMEYFSSPISDAKKIPLKKGDESSIGGKKRSREEQVAGPTARVGLRHLTRELAVPTVPEMLKLRRRQRLQDTTVAARKIVSATSGPPPVSSATVTARPASDEYHLRTELDQDPKFHGKLRSKSKKNPEEEGPAPGLNLPRISLDITSLPSFEPLPKYIKPPGRESVTIVSDRETGNSGYKFASPIKMRESAWNLKSINNFSFSKPINAESKDDSRECNLSSTTMTIPDSFSGSGISSVDGAATNFMWTGSSTAPRLKVKARPEKETSSNVSESPIAKESSELKSGSVMDILGGKSYTDEGSSSQKASPRTSSVTTPSKSVVNIWECAECYIKNDSSDRLCVACKAPKPSSTRNKLSPQAGSVQSNVGKAAAQQPRNIASSTDGFGSQFKMSTNQWECPSCLVRNKQVELVCVSCTTPKPNNTVPSSNNVGSALSMSSAKFDLMDKFKPAGGSWECSGCMLRNPSSVITCPCCNASKPSILNIGPKKPNLDASANDRANKLSTQAVPSSELMDKFKPPTSSWECSSCLVRNNATASSCVCCSNPKPGASPSSDSSATAAKSATSPKSTTTSGWGDEFKKPAGTWACDSCMLQNKAELTECMACGGLKAGAIRTVPTSNFTFGIPTNAQNLNPRIDDADNGAKSETGSSNGFIFGVKSPTVEASATSGQFTFGIPPIDAEKIKSFSTIGEKPTGFVFASPKNPDAGSLKFGVNAKANASETSDTSKTSSVGHEKNETFTFGLPKSVSSQMASGDKETIFGVSSAVGNGKFPLALGVDGNEAGANTRTSVTSFGGATSEKLTSKSTGFASEISQATSSKEADRVENDEQPATITTSLTSTSTSLATTASTAFSTETRPSFTFSEPNSKLRSQATISSGFGETSMPPVASSTFSIGAPKTSGTTLNPGNKQSTMSNFGIGTVGPMASPFGTAPNASASPCASLDESTIEAKSTACPSFGTNAKSTFFDMPEAKKPSAFAAASQQPFFGSSTTPVFGNSSVSSFGTPTTVDTPNIFATGKPNVTAAPTSTGLFTFGAAAPQAIATPAPGGFSFSASGTSANSAAKPIFSFGSTTGIGAPQTNECFASGGASVGGTFGTPASLNPTPSPFTFNSSVKQDSPTFGQASTAIPSMFGAQQTTPSIGQSRSASNFPPNAPASSTGFNFGASAPPAAAGAFNFGGSMPQPASAPTSSFNFNAPSPSIAFDPNTRPSFNFTGGTAPTAFNATPQPATARRIKKAVRRMPQR